MRTVKLTVAYDGSAYHGFQKQKNAVTVQNLLEDVLSKLCGECVLTAGSGRTDAGVHALGQVVTFVTNGNIPCRNIARAAKRMLPADIVIVDAEEAAEDFHARYSAKWKKYLYRIIENVYDSPFEVKYAWQMRETLDIEAMNKAAAYLLGTHDFSAFRSSGSVDGSPVKTMYEACWQRQNGELRFEIGGDGFLYHMVRNLVWSMVQVGLGKRSAEDFAAELQAERCEFLNEPAPAQGLYLKEVFYENYAVIETERLYMRKLRKSDTDNLCAVLQDIDVMYAWEHAFSEREVNDWLSENLRRYQEDGFSYFAVIEKSSGKFLGMAGPLMENINGSKIPGIAYIFAKKYWGSGFAREAAKGSLQYLERRGCKKIVAEVRPENIASRKVAEAVGMKAEGEFIKGYKGKKMPHLLYYKNFIDSAEKV